MSGFKRVQFDDEPWAAIDMLNMFLRGAGGFPWSHIEHGRYISQIEGKLVEVDLQARQVRVDGTDIGSPRYQHRMHQFIDQVAALVENEPVG